MWLKIIKLSIGASFQKSTFSFIFRNDGSL